jgi:dolichol-phosphate mannosyltransferase
MRRVLVIIPTYDEKDNVGPIAQAVLGVQPEANLLFVDAHSPDGTGRILDTMAASDPRLHVLHQASKQGLGRAYIAGFKWALEHNYEFVFEMDADFSHDPKELPHFLEAAEQADLVLGSRYVHGIRITNWPLRRLLLSMGGALYARVITGMPFTDPTGGFKCYRRRVLQDLDLDAIKSNGYSFQIEMTHTVWTHGFRIVEIPITFEDRRAGYSKMSSRIAREALWMVWRLAFRNRFRRTPRLRPPGPTVP